MTSGLRSELGPKIVYIETRYVETDAIHFREVVQRFTGKNSSTAYCVGNDSLSSFEGGSNSNSKGGIAQYGGVCTKPEEYANAGTTDGKNNSLLSSVLPENMSFKDFDAWLSDLPSMEMEELLCSF